VVGHDLATAVHSRASNIFLHHVIIDGQRAELGRIAHGGALIEVGGDVTGVRIENVRAFDPRGWSTLHVFEGARKCTNARVTGNTIGPAGTADDNAWADGISFACRNGLVADNTVVDASDGGIVIFGSPGTRVENNTVVTQHNLTLGGINLVDYNPFGGDYSAVIVRGNRVETRGGGFIKVAIAIGPAVWGVGTVEQINHGGTVVGNFISGNGFGYGIVVDGTSDFTVIGNHVSGHSKGWSAETCDKAHAPPGLAFLRDPSATAGSYQTNFRRGIARWSICVQPPK
jgi:parallel beta-helix repeat protein